MEPKDWVTLVAVVGSALGAVWLTLHLNRSKERLDRKHAIFHTLMATRAQALRGLVSSEAVRALNMIDIEFHDSPGAKPLVTAWKAYFDHLCVATASLPAAAQAVNVEKRHDLYVELLYEMGTFLKYDFDRPLLRRVAYFPQGFIDAESEAVQLKSAVLAVLEGRQPIGMALQVPSAAPATGTAASPPAT